LALCSGLLPLFSFPKVPAKILSNIDISGFSVVVLVAADGCLLLSAEFLFFKTQNLNPLQASLLVPLLNEVVRGGLGVSALGLSALGLTALGLSLNLSKTEALSPPPPSDDPLDDRKGCFGFEGFSGTTLDLVGGAEVTIMVSPSRVKEFGLFILWIGAGASLGFGFSVRMPCSSANSVFTRHNGSFKATHGFTAC
jgi:hypothetical protein